MAIEIVDFPINGMVIFHSYVSLPEGIVFSHFDRGILPDAPHHCFSLQDPQHVAEYTKDIYAHMFAIEGSFQPRPSLDLASQMSCSSRTCGQKFSSTVNVYHIALQSLITKGSVSYLSSPCFSTSLGGIGGPARAIHGILAVMYWISIIRGAPPGHGFNSHGWRGHGPPH